MDYKGASGYIWTRRTIKYAMFSAGATIFLIIVLIGAYQNHENNLKRIAIEHMASKLLGAKVTIAGYYPYPNSHSVYLTDIRLENPPGFNTQYAMGIDKMLIQDVSIDGGVTNLGSISMNQLVVRLAIRQDVTNLMKLADGFQPNAGPDNIKLIIGSVHSTRFILRPAPIPADRDFDPLDLDPLDLKDIGKNEGGLDAAKTSILVLDQVMRMAYRKAAEKGYLQSMQISSLNQIQDSLNIGKGFVDVAINGPGWRRGNLRGK